MNTRPIHRDAAKASVVGFSVIAVLVVVGYIGGVVQTGGALPLRHYTYVKAQFDNVGILKAGKEVKEEGAAIGTVSDIEYVDGVAQVTMRLDGDVDVFKNATARVGNTSALGKKFVELNRGTPGAGLLGDQPIALSATSGSSSLEDVLAAFDPETRRSIQIAVGNLGGGMAGHEDDLHAVAAASPELLEDLSTVMKAAGSSEADISRLIVSADRVARRFDGRTRQISELVQNADKTMEALGVDGGEPLKETIDKAPGALRSARDALDELYGPLGDTEVALEDLEPGAKALGKATPDLRAFLQDSPEVLDKVPGVARDAIPAVTSLTQTMKDLRPVVPLVRTAVDGSAPLLRRFEPYAGDAGQFFAKDTMLDGLIDGDPSKHYFSAALVGVGLFSVAGLPDPLYSAEYYPCPGTSYDHDTITDCKDGAN